MAEIVIMNSESIEDCRWGNGCYPPGDPTIVRLILTQHRNLGDRYCFTDISEDITLEQFRSRFANRRGILEKLEIDSPTTSIIVQTRHWIPGKYFDEWCKVEKDGRYSPWETISILKQESS